MTRLFFALWPDADTREGLARAARQSGVDSRRLVPPQNLHVTLAFLGNVDEALQKRLVEAAAGLRGHAFSLTIDRSGWWRRAGIAWLGPHHVPGELSRLHADIAGLARGSGLALEDRSFRPHVTVARKLSVPPGFEFEPIRWKIRDFCLAASHTLPGGAEYRIICRWPLT